MRCQRTTVIVLSMMTSCFFINGICSQTFARQNKKSPASNAEFQSYLAHLAAANASLRLNETAEAKRWLQPQ